MSIEDGGDVVEDARPCRPGDRTGVHHRMWMVKRVAAVSGDPAPPFLPAWTRSPTGLVPDGHVVLLGDNAELSRDSRLFGAVRTDRVVGVVVRPVTGRRTVRGACAIRSGRLSRSARDSAKRAMYRRSLI